MEARWRSSRLTATGSGPRQSRYFRSSLKGGEKVTSVKMVRPEELPLIGCGESALLFLLGLQLIGQSPPRWAGQSALVQLQHRMLLSSPKQPHRLTPSLVGPRVWAPHGPLKLTH